MSRREKGIVTLLAAILTALWLLFTPGCPFRNATGIPCPGCGMSRAWLAVLRLDFSEAFLGCGSRFSGSLSGIEP